MQKGTYFGIRTHCANILYERNVGGNHKEKNHPLLTVLIVAIWLLVRCHSMGDNCEIKSFKAIVVSYETFDGDTWDNPYYEDFCSLYEGKKLN